MVATLNVELSKIRSMRSKLAASPGLHCTHGRPPNPAMAEAYPGFGGVEGSAGATGFNGLVTDLVIEMRPMPT